ncbi:NAD(P)/FAD-dependent oxidoreductase [Neobacillus notoginsengisoli]|uniref:NAD(P)/FAD-dependent oxidoreductase n=1 Tax=Neobacillus notoginsengisoli TaxID=1578198 RepID=A0A417YRY2_9BACI|nr:NAD(P)/FAD-dependent oxidoreductase [Neobacillus notoginsengisoli]RHW38057.1 NAD(P)/FAD-dependent oxidoreductase [Neobacillus notoginsengisoli]
MQKTNIVILGAGYGGLITNKKIEKLLQAGEANITLINKHDYHYITTQLHKVGVGTACDRKIALSIPELIDSNKTKFVVGSVSNVDAQQQTVLLESGDEIPYDYLVISLGFEVATFGIPGIKEYAFELRSFRSSKAIHHQIIKQLSLYKEDGDPSRLTFAVAGGGFTGIEMLGELAEGLPKLCNEYGVPFDKVKIVGIEAADSLIPFFGEELISYTSKVMEKHRIEIFTSTKILSCTEDAIQLEGDMVLPCRTLIWSCGVKANSVLEKFGIPLVRGKVPVEKDLRVKGLENVFCIGDCALFMKDDQNALPPTAQVAMQQAEVCGENIVALMRHTNVKAFEYHHKGSVASIGDRTAVGKVGSFTMSGWFAAIMKRVIENRYLFVLGGPSLVLKQTLFLNREPIKVAAKQRQQTN